MMKLAGTLSVSSTEWEDLLLLATSGSPRTTEQANLQTKLEDHHELLTKVSLVSVVHPLTGLKP